MAGKGLSGLLTICLLVWGCNNSVIGPNLAPVAVAGPDQAAAPGITILLDGSHSYDPDGQGAKGLGFHWELISAPGGGMAGLTTPHEMESGLKPDAAGVWVIRLVVDDGEMFSLPDLALIRVSGCQEDSQCDDNIQCTLDRCEHGLCLNQPRPDGTACDSGLFCTTGDSCLAGWCQGGQPRDCDDGNLCTEDVCDENGRACLHQPASVVNPEICDNLLDDDCDGLTDLDDTIDCECRKSRDCDDDNQCTNDICDHSGACTHVNNTMHCDDGVFCNGADQCYLGSCSLHTGDPCDPDEECHEETQECLDKDDD